MKKKILDESNEIIFKTINEKEQALISFYSLDQKLIYENSYPLDLNLDDIIKELFQKIPEEKIKKLLKIDKSINKKDFHFYLKLNDNYEKLNTKTTKISSYLYNIHDTVSLLYHNSSTTKGSNSIELKIYIIVKKEYIPEKIEEYISNTTHLIGKPIINKFKYYLYNKYTKELKIIKCYTEDIKNAKLNIFCPIDTYCNANNPLFIYEGNSKSDIIESNKFFCINLMTNKINLISSNFPKRKLHSMIYIPKCYIYILGGKDTKEALIYKIQNDNKNYEKYPFLLPSELLEPSLIYINNKYLYIFENNTFDFKIFRINLNYNSPFEIIKLKNEKIIPMNQKFFGVVRNQNSILFLGGQMIHSNNNKNYCFEFNFDSSKLEISNREFKPINFIEKTFIPLGNNIYIQLIEYKKENKYEPKILFFEGKSY